MARALVASAWASVSLAVLAIALFALVVLSGLLSSSSISSSLTTRRAVVPVFALTAVAYIVSLPAEQFRAVLRASNRVALAQTIATAGLIAAALGGITAVWLRPTVLAFALSQAAVMVITALVSVVVSVRVVHLSGARLDLRGSSVAEVRSLLSPSFLFLVIALSGTLIWSTDNLLIAWHLGTAQVTPYAVSLRLTTIASSVISVIVVTLLPSVTSLWALKEMDRLRALCFLTTRVTVVVGAILAVELLLLGPAFILKWVGVDGLTSASTFYVFVAIFLIRAVAQSMELIVIGLSRHAAYAAVALGEGVLNLVLSLVLIRHLGVFGVALGTLVAHIICTGWFLPWWATRTLELRLLPFVRPLVTAVAAALISWLAGRTIAMVMPPQSWLSLVINGAAIAVTYAAAYGCIGLAAAERRSLVTAVRRRVLRTGAR